MALACVASPATADPVADFVEAIFRPQEARLHPYYYGWRKTRRVRERAHVVGADMLASYYGGGEYLNRHTANGEVFRASGFTAAHRSLPFGTYMRVCYHGCVTVRVNDRGPAKWTGRSLDLSRGAARAIGMTRAGVARVRTSVPQ
jgi:rare lipoprotein A